MLKKAKKYHNALKLKLLQNSALSKNNIIFLKNEFSTENDLGKNCFFLKKLACVVRNA